jgi:hypothetical protein
LSSRGHFRGRSIDAQVLGYAGGRENLLALQALLVDEDSDECVPDGLSGPGQEVWRCGKWSVALEEEDDLFLFGDSGELGGGDWRGKWGHVELGADEAVEVIDGADCGGFAVGEGDGEEFFAAETDFYGVEAHGENCA